MRVNGILSALFYTGVLQERVLSPLLFVPNTYERRSLHDGHRIIKLADDSVVVFFLNRADRDHGPIAADFTDW